MSSAVAELEAGLQAMLAAKPPGVSGTRINSLTALCMANIKSESVLIQKLYTHFKKTPGTHKLGVLYVVDSVTRRWLDQAKQQGQVVNSSAEDGTFAAGVNRVTELMPVLMNDILSTMPADQKEKIKKLLDIWEKGQTFPPQMVQSFKEKLNAPASKIESTTPPGSPPPNALLNLPTSQPGPPAVPSNILETLANIARQQTASAAQNNTSIPAAAPPAAPPTAPLPFSFPGLPPTNPAVPVSASPMNPYLAGSQPPPAPHQAVNAPPLPFQMLQPVQSGQVPPAVGAPSNQANGLQAILQSLPVAGALAPAPAPLPAPAPAPALAAGALDPKAQQQLIVLQTLVAQGIPIEQIGAILSQMNAPAPASVPPPHFPPPVANTYSAAAAPPPPAWNASHPDESRDRPYPGALDRQQHGRSRSRSPPRQSWDPRDSPRSRDERGFGQYGRRASPARGRHDDHDGDRARGRGGSEYRQRSPQGRHDGPSRPTDKWVEFDPSIPQGHIKVLSRTLFVGGVTCSEAELRAVFSRYGEVQTCIVNKDKRHAFVKMYTRKDAVTAKEAMEEGRAPDNSLRTRWGVGFGPRDCSDYQTGISIIPIAKLTEADRKWMLTAPYGGSGGKPIATGLTVEEPDIEIGAGVSSKAISRRMQTDRGGANGPRSTRRDDDHATSGGAESGGGGGGSGGGGGHGGHGGGRFGRRGGGRGENRRENRTAAAENNVGAQPVVPDFPFGIATGANGMPIFPPNFSFPAPEGQPNQSY